MKLGFLITKTKNGYVKGKPINGGTWGQFAYDIRSFTRYFLEDFDEVGKEAILLRFLGVEGFLVGVFRTESGRLGDNTTVWIYVPSGVRISGKELEEIVNEVRVEIKKHLVSMDDIRESCLRLFEKDYDQKSVQQTAVGRLLSKGIGASNNVTEKSEGDNPSATVQEKLEVAGLYYGEGADYQLHELLGDYLAQPGYKEWAGIFLIDKQSDIRILNEYKPSLCKTVVFSLPDRDNGFTPSYKGSTYRGKIEVTEGSAITVIWERKGYQSIIKPITISKSDEKNQGQAQISPNEIKYGIYRSWFKVVDEDGADICAVCSIKVNGNELRKGGEPTYISAVKEYEVVICCHGYKTMRGEEAYREEFSSFNGQIPTIRFKADRIEGRFILKPEESNGLKHSAEVRIETRYPDDPKKKMPIMGYELDDKGKMVYNDFKSAWARIKWFLIGFLVMAAIWGVSAGTKWFKENYTINSTPWFIHQKVETPGNGKTAPAKQKEQNKKRHRRNNQNQEDQDKNNGGNNNGDNSNGNSENNIGDGGNIEKENAEGERLEGEDTDPQTSLNGGMSRNAMTYSLLS